jgi:hypothetical protein
MPARYKIELKYFCGWDDAGWTEEANGRNRPVRFSSLSEAQATLDDFFRAVKVAVIAGDIDCEADRADYRIVQASD